MFNGAYHIAYHITDMMPKGRDEDELPFSMAWLNRHGQYRGFSGFLYFIFLVWNILLCFQGLDPAGSTAWAFLSGF